MNTENVIYEIKALIEDTVMTENEGSRRCLNNEDLNKFESWIKTLEQANGAKKSDEKCTLPVVSPCLFYVVAASQYEEGKLEQITNGLTYERAIKYRDGDFCKSKWSNAYILASLNEG